MQETISLVLPPSVSMKEILKYTLLVEVALCCPLLPFEADFGNYFV